MAQTGQDYMRKRGEGGGGKRGQQKRQRADRVHLPKFSWGPVTHQRCPETQKVEGLQGADGGGADGDEVSLRIRVLQPLAQTPQGILCNGKGLRVHTVVPDGPGPQRNEGSRPDVQCHLFHANFHLVQKILGEVQTSGWSSNAPRLGSIHSLVRRVVPLLGLPPHVRGQRDRPHQLQNVSKTLRLTGRATLGCAPREVDLRELPVLPGPPSRHCCRQGDPRGLALELRALPDVPSLHHANPGALRGALADHQELYRAPAAFFPHLQPGSHNLRIVCDQKATFGQKVFDLFELALPERCLSFD
mmetsp:Transcript_10080/g.34814  ORF Transcript_10080/g.34814 Transcript_10080/m.34814 type:complete len:302 (-) Transcript_10080:335-1240(-)